VVFVTLLGRLEVGQEVVVWLHSDDLAVLCPYLSEQREQELAPLGWLGLQLPEAGEVLKERAGSVDGGLGRRSEALHFFLQRLATHDVPGLGEVAENVEVLQALELVEEFASPLPGRLGAGGVDGLEGWRRRSSSSPWG
jgi:hypothetical protein